MEQKHQSKRSDNFLTPSDRPWRIAYPYLHEKRTTDAQGKPLAKPHHEITVAVPKLSNDPTQCEYYKFLMAFIMDACNKAWGPTWPQGANWPLKDGDVPPQPKVPLGGAPVTVDPKSWEWRKGHWYFKAGCYLEGGPRIAIRDPNTGSVQELPARTFNGRTWYKSGDYAVLQLSAYTYANQQAGVNIGFDGVLFVAEGEAIGNSGPKSAAAMFAGVTGPVAGSVPAPAGPPSYAAPPGYGASPPGQGYAPPIQPGQAPGYAPPAAPVAAGGPPMPPGYGGVPVQPTYNAAAPAPAMPPMPPAAMAPAGAPPALPPFPR